MRAVVEAQRALGEREPDARYALRGALVDLAAMCASNRAPSYRRPRSR
jgi:hypothetical protein